MPRNYVSICESLDIRRKILQLFRRRSTSRLPDEALVKSLSTSATPRDCSVETETGRLGGVEGVDAEIDSVRQTNACQATGKIELAANGTAHSTLQQNAEVISSGNLYLKIA